MTHLSRPGRVSLLGLTLLGIAALLLAFGIVLVVMLVGGSHAVTNM